MSYAEYLAFEAASDTKHEYRNGEVFARTETITHGALTAAIGSALSVEARRGELAGAGRGARCNRHGMCESSWQ